MAYSEESVETTSDFVNFDIEEEVPVELMEMMEMVDARGIFADSTKLKDFVTCRNCKQEFDHDSHNPFLLPCLDAVCKSCIEDIIISEKQVLECDQCHCIHTCFQNGEVCLQVDSTRTIAIEIVRLTNGESSIVCEMCTNHKIATHRCFDCSFFICADCVKLHSTLKPFKLHSVLEIKGLLSEEEKYMSLFKRSNQCPVNGHENETLKMYCLDTSCRKPVCILCCITTHKGHAYCNIADIGKQSKTKIRDLLRIVASKGYEAQITITELQDMNDKCQQDSKQIQNEIKAWFNDAKKKLELREKTLSDAVAVQLSDKQRCIENERKKIMSFINSCKQACYYGNISPTLNDHQSFLAIDNSIQLQLENLESQAIENQVSMDTMRFFPKRVDTSITSSINSFGKILVTKVSPTKSKVVVKAPNPRKGVEVKFQIQLFSSTGIPIVDEKVTVHLKYKEQFLKSIQCAIGASSSTFIGIWIPDKPFQFSWIVVSNGIELETLEGVITIEQDMEKENQTCVICMDTATKPKQLVKCGHIFCKDCITQYFQFKPVCPVCNMIYGKLEGDQPPGSISIMKSLKRLDGYKASTGSIVLTYEFCDGKLGKEHPDPGKGYHGITRSSYVPNNDKGRLVAKLLNVAFSRGLLFTIGISRSTRRSWEVIWNDDIHHKTRPDGGPLSGGYPDPTYLDRVLEELEAKGVTEESADDPEEYILFSEVFRYCY